MPKYEVNINGQRFEIEAQDDQSVQLAVKQLAGQHDATPQALRPQQSWGDWALDKAQSFTGSAIEGVPVVGPLIKGGVDRAAAGTLSMMYGAPYADTLKRVQDDYRETVAENPKTSLVGNIAGSVAGTVPMVMAAPAAFGAGGGSLLTRSLASGATGAALGGADAAVRSGGDVGKTATGAFIGGGAGLVTPMIAQGIGRGARAAADHFGAWRAARQAGTRPEVARLLTATMAADDSLGPQGAANMARAGREAMLADAGPNARSILDTSIQRGGPGAVSARQAIEARTARGAHDLTAALDNTLGQPRGLTPAGYVTAGERAAMNRAYQTAYARPIDYSHPVGMEIEQIVRGRVPHSAIQAANSLMRANGEQSRQILARVADDGSVVFERLPDVRQLDYITRGLNQIAQSAEGQGALGGTTPLGRAYGNLAGEIRTRLRSLVPEYGAALDRAGTEIGKVDAARLGARILSSAVTRTEARQAIDGMGQAERAALTQSIRQNIDDQVANVQRAVTDGNMDAREAIKGLKLLSSRANQEKVAEVIGPQQAAPLFQELDRILTSFELRAAVAENSKTFARLATDKAVSDITAPGAIGLAAQGKPLNAVQRIAQVLSRQTPDAIAGREREIYSDISRLLTQPAPQSIATWRALQNYQAAGQPQAQAIGDRTAAIVRALMASSPPVANQRLLAR